MLLNFITMVWLTLCDNIHFPNMKQWGCNGWLERFLNVSIFYAVLQKPSDDKKMLRKSGNFMAGKLKDNSKGAIKMWQSSREKKLCCLGFLYLLSVLHAHVLLTVLSVFKMYCPYFKGSSLLFLSFLFAFSAFSIFCFLCFCLLASLYCLTPRPKSSLVCPSVRFPSAKFVSAGLWPCNLHRNQHLLGIFFIFIFYWGKFINQEKQKLEP